MLAIFVVSLMPILSLVHFCCAVIPNSLPPAKVIPYIEGESTLHPTCSTTCIVAIFLALVGIFVIEQTFRFIPLPS